MGDAFRPCGSANKAGFACWLCYGHGPIHETHPCERGKSREAGASPVWHDADPTLHAKGLAACRFCGGVISCDQQKRWYLTDHDTNSPWSCPANAAGHWPQDH